MGARMGAPDDALARAAPLPAMPGMAGDTPAGWLATGQALERVRLAAAGTGLQAGALTPPVRVAGLRMQLQGPCRTHGAPQILPRQGAPDGRPDRAPRRPLGDVLPG